MKRYKALHKQTFAKGKYSIVPIRFEDRLDIMQWRNEQIYHLRQNGLLTIETQNRYFEKKVNALFEEEKPNQLLFSYMKDNKCIGYGGLVHINWIDKNAEISFIMDTKLEEKEFQWHWSIYLSLMEQVAFTELGLHKTYTYAFDLRPHLYEVLENAGFIKEAVLKEHCYLNNKFFDVVIHAKTNWLQDIRCRKASFEDLELFFEWANDDQVRFASFRQRKISFEEHTKWFKKKLAEPNTFLLLFHLGNSPVGQIRIEKDGNINVIGISIDEKYRGLGIAPVLLSKACQYFWQTSSEPISAFIKPSNLSSINAFKKSGFIYENRTSVNNSESMVFKIERNY